MADAPYTVPCVYCGIGLSPRDDTIWRRVVGWERKAGIRASGKHGGSDIAARELRDEYACSTCVRRLQRGLSPTQGTML